MRGLYGIADDVTARNRTTRELEIARQLAVEASDAKSRFQARMSHEIRTPLTSILATIELLAQIPASEEQLELIGTLQRSGGRLLDLVDDVLDFARAGTAGLRATGVFDLHATIRDTVALVEKSARHRGLRLELRLDPAVPRRVRDHPTWTTQILTNLLTNAVDHTDAGLVELSVSPTTTALAGPAILYRVRDTGAGIDPARHELVFKPFTQLPGQASGRHHSGLGLSIVKQMVTLSGGTIALDSTPGHGTTFFVLMPAEAVDD